MALSAHPLVLIQVMASAMSSCHHHVDLTMSILKLNPGSLPSFTFLHHLSTQHKPGTLLSAKLDHVVLKELELVSGGVWKSGGNYGAY